MCYIVNTDNYLLKHFEWSYGYFKFTYNDFYKKARISDCHSSYVRFDKSVWH